MTDEPDNAVGSEEEVPSAEVDGTPDPIARLEAERDEYLNHYRVEQANLRAAMEWSCNTTFAQLDRRHARHSLPVRDRCCRQ
jgi:hypothetical protein